jgi:hypothetical protein
VVAELVLKNGEFDEGLTSIDPTLVGRIDAFGDLAGLIVQFDYDGDGIADGETIADGSGRFEITPRGLTPSGVELTVSARAADSHYSVPPNGPEFTAYGPWRELTWDYPGNDAPEIAQFELLNDTGPRTVEANGVTLVTLDRITSDPTLIGRVSNDNSAASLKVEFDHNDDEIVDGFTFTDADGVFRYTPQGLTAGSWDIRVRAIEFDSVADEWLEGDWEHITSDGDPGTVSVFYGFTLVEPTTSTTLNLYASGNGYDPTITGNVEDGGTSWSVHFFQGLQFLGSTAVHPDATFTFTPIGLDFSDVVSPLDQTISITAKAVHWDYFANTEAVIDTDTIDIGFWPATLRAPESGGLNWSDLNVSGLGQAIADSKLDPTVKGNFNVPTRTISGTSLEVVTPLYVEVEVGDGGPVFTAPVEAVASDTNPSVVQYSFTFRPELESSSSAVPIKFRPVGVDSTGYVFGAWSIAVNVTFDREQPSLNETGEYDLPDDYVPTIQGTVSADPGSHGFGRGSPTADRRI